MQKISKVLIVILIVLTLAACGGATPAADVNVPMTSVVNTMVASYFETVTALAPPLTDTPVSTQTFIPLPTATQFRTPTPLPSATFVYYTATLGSLTPTGTLITATINPDALAVGCNNLYFIRDVTIPAGTVLKKNQDFTKTWKVQNTGTCNWLYQYILVPLGDSFGGGSPKIQKLVKPDSWSELSVDVTAPNKPGTYTSYWRLSNGQSMFGATLALSFVVADQPTSTPVPSITNTFTLVPSETPSETPTPTPTPTP